MKHRHIMRIVVAKGTSERLDKSVKQFGSTHASVQSRVAEWLVRQDDTTIASILGLYPFDIRAELPTRIIKAIRNTDQL